MPTLPNDLLNIIFSQTGSPAAVLAAGAAGMRTWSAQQIADWLLQRFALKSLPKHMIPRDALGIAVAHRLDGPARLLFLRAREAHDVDAMGHVIESSVEHGYWDIARRILCYWDNHVSGYRADEVCHLMMEAACRYGQLEILRKLMKGAFPDACLPEGLTSELLQVAATYGHASLVTALLDATSDDDGYIENEACYALSAAAQHGHVRCVRVLLDKSRASASASNNEPLMLAAQGGHAHTVATLLDTSRSYHATADARDSAALWQAARNGHADVLRVLLSQEHRPADPLSENGKKAIAEVLRQGNIKCIRAFLAYIDRPPRTLSMGM